MKKLSNNFLYTSTIFLIFIFDIVLGIPFSGKFKFESIYCYSKQKYTQKVSE